MDVSQMRVLPAACRELAENHLRLPEVLYVFNIKRYILKGAVSFRFSQGLPTLMCNNSKLKADIDFFLLRRQRSKVYNWLQNFMI